MVKPDLFKRVLGEYSPQFQGFGQHDSHECTNTVLDLLNEDLFRKGSKQTLEIEKTKPEDAAKEAWNRYIFRNESIITDLFFGLTKSTVTC